MFPQTTQIVLSIFSAPVIFVCIALFVFTVNFSLWKKSLLFIAEPMSGIKETLPRPVILFNFRLLVRYLRDRRSELDFGPYYLYSVTESSVLCIRITSVDELQEILSVTPERGDPAYVYMCSLCNDPVHSPSATDVYCFDLLQANVIRNVFNSDRSKICNRCLESVQDQNEFELSDKLRSELVATKI